MDYDKLNKRLDHMFDYETDNFFVNINLKTDVEKKLYDFQVLHVFNLITAFRSNHVILDGSDTGTGKTFTSIALCKQLNIRPFIICPKTIISSWVNVCKIFNVTPIAITNYESIKNGKAYDCYGKHINCDFVEISKNTGKNTGKNKDSNIEFKWNLPRNSIIIFDEVHKCKNVNSQNAKLLLSTREQQKVLLLSATISDKPQYFHIFGYMLGCYNKLRQASNWINGMILEDKMCLSTKDGLSSINKFIYPTKGSRMRIKELGSKFPSNQVTSETYFINDEQKELVNKAFGNITKNTLIIKSSLENKNNNGQILGEIMKARQLVEKIKIPIIIELANDYINNGYNVVIFANFTESIKKLAESLKTTCIISGSLDTDTRNKNVQRFQDNESNIIICNIAITEGISLHDIHGVPRVSLISPSFSVTQLIQALGRISRTGAKTPALQRIIYCANTCEEIICNRLKNKLDFLSKLNDNDLIDIQ